MFTSLYFPAHHIPNAESDSLYLNAWPGIPPGFPVALYTETKQYNKQPDAGQRATFRDNVRPRLICFLKLRS